MKNLVVENKRSIKFSYGVVNTVHYQRNIFDNQWRVLWTSESDAHFEVALTRVNPRTNKLEGMSVVKNKKAGVYRFFKEDDKALDYYIKLMKARHKNMAK